MKTGKKASEPVINRWIVRDLSLAAANGQLVPAFEREEAIAEVGEVLASGRHPILVGEAGVGKTAIIHEIARRAYSSSGPAALRGRRILQLSLRHRAGGLKDINEIGVEMQKLVGELLQGDHDIVPFFCDVHTAYRFNLASHFNSLAFGFTGPVLGEGDSLLLSNLHRCSKPDHWRAARCNRSPSPAS